MLLRELTGLHGVSGDETRVADFIRKQAEGVADEIFTDALGNVIALKQGRRPGTRVMLSAHMDEVGFIITGYGEGGTLSFKTIGGMDERILPGKKVAVGDGCIPGVIGIKPVHLLQREEKSRAVKLKELYIDIGARSREEAEKTVGKGDYAAFLSDYVEFGNGLVKAKALDDRIGCWILLEALKNTYAFDVYACFTVQEEVGLRGAEVAAHRVKPEIAIVVEGTTCSDVPGVEKQDYSTVLGAGPAITFMDRTTYPDRNLAEFIFSTAEKRGIKAQFKQTVTGGNDAGKIQKSREGSRVAAISAPCRYIHSPASVASIEDIENLRKLVLALLDEFSGDPGAMKNIINGRKANV